MRTYLGTRSNTMTHAVLAILVAAFALGALGGTTAAAAPVRESVAMQLSGASKTECVEQATHCTSTSLLVTATDARTQACLEIATYTISSNEVTAALVERGCGSVAQGAFSFEPKDLSAAGLSQTTITLQVAACDAQGCAPTGSTRDVVVAATFTGIGDIGTVRTNSRTTFGGCAIYFVGKGSSRDAQVSISIDDRSFDVQGFLATSSQKLLVVCH